MPEYSDGPNRPFTPFFDAEALASRVIGAVLVHGFENDAGAERTLREQQSGVARLLRREFDRALSPTAGSTAGVMDADAMRRGKELLKARDARTSYTVAAEANAALNVQELLVRADEIKTWLDDTVKVGTHEGRTMVFNKREAAAKIAQIVNDRFNARRR